MRGNVYRSSGALNRFLLGKKQDAKTLAHIAAGSCNADMLADLLVAIDEATIPVKSASEPSTSSSDLSLLAQLMTPADKTKEPEQREANAKLISAAAAIQGDQMAWARLAEMKRLYDAKDYATLAQLKESEQNANVLRLLLADVPDIQSTLQGRLPVDKIDLICDVRRAYLVRLLHVLFPSSKPEHVPPRVKTAVHNLMIGRLGRTKLLELIDHGHDPHKIEDPLAGRNSSYVVGESARVRRIAHRWCAETSTGMAGADVLGAPPKLGCRRRAGTGTAAGDSGEEGATAYTAGGLLAEAARSVARSRAPRRLGSLGHVVMARCTNWVAAIGARCMKSSWLYSTGSASNLREA